MTAVGNVGNWLRPSSVSIFAQPPGQGFAAFVLQQVSFPSAQRVRLDLAETETHARTYSVARHPVEQIVAQNKVRNPDVLTVMGVLSATPMSSPLSALGLARLDKKALEQLRDLADRDTVLFVVTPERYVPNMLLESIIENYDESVTEGVNLTLTFREARIVIPGLVDSVFDADNIGVGAGSTSDLGPQSGAAVPDPGGLG